LYLFAVVIFSPLSDKEILINDDNIDPCRAFFNGTAVECVLVQRAKLEGVLASEFVGTCYTHHQKTVICDGPVDDGSDRRRVVGKGRFTPHAELTDFHDT
jgi:hypothetical protein